MAGRLDAELVRRGLARSRRHAAGLLAAGRVRLDGRVASKPSTVVGPERTIAVVPDPQDPGYVSRAAYKLAGVLDALGDHAPRIAGARCLDLGASTGGFTDVLLRRGAAHVLAVDVGHDQLVPALRGDPRVTAREGLNVRELTRADVGAVPDLVVADLSFISLATVLPAVAGVVGPETDLLLLVKPQFEVGRERLGRGGVVRDPALHREVVASVAHRAAELGMAPVAVVPSPLPGPSGNREYFWWLRADARGTAVNVVSDAAGRVRPPDAPPEPPDAIARAVADAVRWEPDADRPGPAPGAAPPPVGYVRPPVAPTGRAAPAHPTTLSTTGGTP